MEQWKWVSFRRKDQVQFAYVELRFIYDIQKGILGIQLDNLARRWKYQCVGLLSTGVNLNDRHFVILY